MPEARGLCNWPGCTRHRVNAWGCVPHWRSLPPFHANRIASSAGAQAIEAAVTAARNWVLNMQRAERDLYTR